MEAHLSMFPSDHVDDPNVFVSKVRDENGTRESEEGDRQRDGKNWNDVTV